VDKFNASILDIARAFFLILPPGLKVGAIERKNTLPYISIYLFQRKYGILPTQFPRNLIPLDLSNIQLKLRPAGDKTSVFDPIRKKWLVLTPEEHVRQFVIRYLTGVMQYPASLMAVEKNIKVGTLNRRFDIVVYNRDDQPWMLVECKAPEIPVSESTLRQLLNYQSTVQSTYLLLTNGHQTFCADAGKPEDIKWLPSLPQYP